MSLRAIIRAQDCPQIAWKNGGGTTREIAVFPPGAGMSNFDWRLSMAQVVTAGPFSTFVDIDRKLAVLRGTLHLAGPDVEVRLDAASEAFDFGGDVPIMGSPLDGPATDLNAMTRRGRFVCCLTRLRLGDRAEPCGTTFLVALEPQTLCAERFGCWDSAILTEAAMVNGAAFQVSFTRQSM